MSHLSSLPRRASGVVRAFLGRRFPRRATLVLLVTAVTLWSAPGVARAQSPEPSGPAATPPSDPGVAALEQEDADGASTRVSRPPAEPLDQAEEEFEEYDPWMPFNEKTFDFNYKLDKYAIKPVAKAYDKVVPNVVERTISNFFENLGSVRRIFSLAVQGRFNDSGQELGRFVINTVFGVGGLADAAPSFGVGKVDADMGQTLGVWGLGPGPYLVLPFFEPLTIRDAVGLAVDAVIDPTTWLVPFEFGFGGEVVRRINDRARNLELFENVEETVFDLYSAVRNGYLQQRRAMIREGLAASPFGPGKQERSESGDTTMAGVSTPPAPPPGSEDVGPASRTTPSPSAGLFEVDRESFLIVDAAPSEAEVFVDGRSLGSAGELLSRALPVPRGQHIVAIAAKGFRTHVSRFVADRSFPVRLTVALVPE